MGVTLALAAALLACRSARSDFDQLCTISGEAISDPKIERPFKLGKIRERFGARRLSRGARLCLEATLDGSLPPAQSYPAFEACAHENGAPKWSCPALRDFMMQPDEPVRGGP